MAVDIKVAPDEKLELVQTYITDTNLNSDYFNISELPDTFSGGKNAFLIAGSDKLLANTEIKIQIRDAAGNVCYVEYSNGSPEYYEGNSKVAAVYVYPTITSFGPATITILGQLKDVPQEWNGLYSVKWTKQVNINPALANTTRVRFYKRPLVSITEIVEPLYTIVSGSKTASLIQGSFASIKVNQLETFAGDVKRIKVYRTAQGDISDYDLIQDILVESKNLLTTYELSGSVVGDGGLFSQPFQNIVNSDLSNEYGSCESLRSVMNTPVGLFFISQAQGKIFHFTGQTLDPISNAGMKWWFNKYLPSQLVKQYPQLEVSPLSDNPVVGVGCQTIYDPNDDIVYFMKKDYRVKASYIADVTYTEKRGFALSGNPITLGDPIFFDDCSWTVSYDPKSKAWISFHDWHPEFALPSINHFFTTKTMATTIPQCPPGYNYNSTNGLCERSININEPAIVTVDQLNAVVNGGPADCLIDIVIAMDVSGSTNSNGARQAQPAWLTAFLNDPNITGPMAAGTMQIGFTAWDGANRNYNIPNPAGGTWSMSNTVTEPQVTAWYNANWTGGSTNVSLGMSSALTMLNNKTASQLGNRSAQPFFRQIIILVTDTTSDPGNIGCPFQGTGVSPSATGPANQRVYALFCGATSAIPTGNVLGNISCTPGPVNVDGYQFGINASVPATFATVATAIAGSVCSIPFVCTCAPGYTKVFYNTATSVYTSPTGVCDDITPPVCRKVTCACPVSPVGTTTTTTGNCDDVYLLGNPTYINPNPQICNFFKYESTPANYKVGSFWRHNVRCDSFANFYGTDYPWEVELVSNTGQMVNTVRSMEYQLESYVYKGDMGFACNDDRWEDLNFNFDQSVIYNNEQVSGLLQLTPTPYNNPVLELSYPIINLNSMNILCSKVEQKYRFNQFYDITNDRGEFTNVEQSIWDTQPNGYIKVLNTINLNYNKPPLQHKKFRHYYNNVILRRVKSENRKMLLRLNNTKLLLSMR